MRKRTTDKTLWYTADFETTGVNYYVDNGCTKVWLWAVCDSTTENVKIGNTIEEFFEYCKSNLNKSLIYFHNLKFDGSFIVNWLLDNEFKYEPKLTTSMTKSFNTLITQDGAWYQIEINFTDKKRVTIQDSLKIIPLPIKTIAKAFSLPILKEVIDYDKYIRNPETESYITNDVRIACKGLKFFKENGFNKMTIGSNAYNNFNEEYPHIQEMLPTLDKDFLVKWRRAYRGGRSQVNPKYASKVLHNVRRYDINSMYPYIMSRKPLPYGNPVKINKRNSYKFELYEVEIGFKLKKGHLPTLLKNGSIGKTSDTYYIETESIENILISNIDLELLEKHYDIYSIEFIEMWGFKTCSSMFREWIDKHYELKSNSEGGIKLVHKLMINNLYGKYGSKCQGMKKIPVLASDGRIVFGYGENEDMKKYYLPLAIAITSYAHAMIDHFIMVTGYKNFVYCDTDSIHTLGTLPDEVVDSKKIGYFKMEGIEETCKYVRQKCYCFRELKKDGTFNYEITCAGMNAGVKSYLIRMYGEKIFDVFDIGLKVDMHSKGIRKEELKLLPKQVKGGVILAPTSFNLL